MQKSALGAARGAGANQIGMFPQQSSQRSEVTGDDGVRRKLKVVDREIRSSDGSKMAREFRLALQALGPSDGELGSRESACLGYLLARECRETIGPIIDVDGEVGSDLEARQADEGIDPVGAPGADRGRIGTTSGLQQVFGAFLVIVEAGARRERESVLRIGEHTKLLSQLPGVRTEIRLKEGSSFRSMMQVGTALSADWRRPSRSRLE